MALLPGTDLNGLAESIPTSGFGGPEDPLRVWPLAPWSGEEDFAGQVAVGIALGRWTVGVHRTLPLPSGRRNASDRVTLYIRNLWGPALIDQGFIKYWQTSPAGAELIGPWSQPGFLLVAAEGYQATLLRGVRLGPWTMRSPTAGDGFLSVDAADGEVAWGLEVVRSQSGHTTHFVMSQAECEEIDAVVRMQMISEAIRDVGRPEWLLHVAKASVEILQDT